MKVAKLVLLVLSITCGAGLLGCGGGEPKSWREIARFQGDAKTWTPTFNVEADSVRVNWATQSDARTQKLFVLDLVKPGYQTQTERVVDSDGPDQGAKVIPWRGRLNFQIEANQPWEVWVEVPE